MLNIADGIASEVIGLMLLVAVVFIVYMIVKALARGAIVAIVSSVVVGVFAAWVLFAGGLEMMVGETADEANDLGTRTSNTIPYDFGG